MTHRRPGGPPVRRGALKSLLSKGRLFGYGFVAQVCSAATNFALIVLAAHALGPSGLGTVLIGFATYVLLLGFLRALLTEPLITRSAGQEPDRRAASADAAISLGLAAAVAVAVVLGIAGFFLPGSLGRGILLFAPWSVPALLQDIGRSIVFRDRADKTVVYSDAAWLAAMAVLVPIAFLDHSDWVTVACWGIGGGVGAVVALRQLHWRPRSLKHAMTWWKSEAALFARWLGTQQLLYGITSYATVLLVAGILGTRDYGGLRAVQSVFTPLTLLGPALALPGLPLVARLIEPAPGRALRVAAKLALLITGITAVYVVTLYALPSALGTFFGGDFDAFHDIMIPIGLGQVLAAPAYGLTLFLKAQQRGRTLLWLGTLNAVVYLALTVALASAFGLTGAAWGAVGTGIVSVAALAFTFRPQTWLH